MPRFGCILAGAIRHNSACSRPVPSYERVLPYLAQLDADVITFECASSDGKDLPLIAKIAAPKKVAIGVVNHTTTIVERPNEVAALIRKALEYIPAERLVISSDCGFGREGLSRRIAFYKNASLWCRGQTSLGVSPVCRKPPLGTADPLYAFSPPSAELIECRRG